MTVATISAITPAMLPLVAGHYGWKGKSIYTYGACAICGGQRSYYIGSDQGVPVVLSDGSPLSCNCDMSASHAKLAELYNRSLPMPAKQKIEIGSSNGQFAEESNEGTQQTDFDVDPYKPLPLVDLQAMDFKPLVFLVEGLIALGQLVMLAGRPKSGKSWLALQLAMSIDSGIDFLGRTTQRGKILYLALEDGQRRIHQRSKIIKWTPTSYASVLFEVACFDSEYGGQGPGIDHVDELASDYDLIVIDTLIATLSGVANENDNAQMGAIVNALAKIAHETDTAIFLVHHTGKVASDDVFNTLRGASAIRGGYDVGLLLQRKNDEREAVLFAESRDYDAESMTLRQVPGGVGWEHIGNKFEIERIRAGRKTLRAMLEHPAYLDGLTVEQISEQSGTSNSNIHKQLLALEKSGYVNRKEQPSTQKGKKPDIWHVAEKYHNR